MRILAATQPDKTARATNLGRLGHTLLSEALRMTFENQQKQSVPDWLRDAEQQLPQRAAELYEGVKKQDIQLPELMDFGSRKTTAITGGLR